MLSFEESFTDLAMQMYSFGLVDERSFYCGFMEIISLARN